MALKDFTDAVAVITGGASGIGLATARALYAKGAHIVLADINSKGLEQAEQLVRQQHPTSHAKVLSVVTDVTNYAQVQALMQEALTTCGHVDLVVTCAGIGRGGPIDLFSAAEMQATMDINFMGTFHCVKAALSAMRQQQGGHFVFISSVAGKLGAALLTGYCASKWAVRGFSIALRIELYGTGIGVTTVYPAWVDTPMFRQESDALRELNIKAELTPDQVATAILQAVENDQRDLTLAPNPDIAFVLQLMQDNPEKAEELAGQAFQRRRQKLASQQNQ
jgi:NAD(P)-dependent dehydrogenase (short-subunit alcohol dehydrogenase family)